MDLLEQIQLERLRAALAERYEIERPVGEGGMATVYLAHDRRHGRKVAVKVLRTDLAASIGGDRFLREIQVAANLQHPHIIALYDSGEARGFLYYVMPYIEGESLRTRMDRERQLSLPECLRIIREAAEALDYAHRQGILHRDIKPENILLQDGHALVADFGIARAVDWIGGDALTRPGVILGTPQYMSPEQGVGETDLDGRSDVYGLGCVLYEMLAGDPPFQGRSATSIMARHSLEQVPGLRVVRQSIPEEVEATVLRALEKAPADRFRMSEFVEALADLQATVATRTTSSREMPGAQGPPPRAGAITRSRRRVRVWSVGLVASLLLAGAWVAWHRQRSEPAPGAAGGGLDPRHIAVLYFEQRRGQDSLAYLADGITEELIQELSVVPTLRVISRNGVGPYQGKKVAPDSIARALKVGTLVQGTVDQADDRLRLSVSLIDGTTGAVIGSTRIERPHQEIFALQEDLAKEVSIFLRRRLGQEVRLRENRARAVKHDPRAWHLFQHAEELAKDVDPLLEAADTSGAASRLQRADSLLALAEQVEPGWARAIVSRGWLAFRRLDLVGNFNKKHYDDWTATGLKHASRALATTAGDPEALELRGTLRYYRWVFNLARDSAESATLIASAEADLQAAGDASPPAAFGLTLLSHLLMAESRPAQAKLAALRAYNADPYLATAKQTISRLFDSSLDLEDGKEARRWCEEGRQRFPEYYRFTECQIRLYALEDQPPDPDRAWRLYRRYLELAPPNARVFHEHYGQMLVAIALARAGLADSAQVTALRARANPSLDETRDLSLLEAIVWTLLENRDEALRHLSIYLSANPQLRAGMAQDDTWWFKDLRDDPRYHAMVSRGPATR